MPKKTSQSAERFFLAYYEVQLMGATLYLHVVIKAKDSREAGAKFFSQPTREFGDVVLNTKGVCGGSVGLKEIPEEWARMLQEPGGPIDLKKLKVPKVTAARRAALADAGVTAADIASGKVRP
jgi:hypothetical protein